MASSFSIQDILTHNDTATSRKSPLPSSPQSSPEPPALSLTAQTRKSLPEVVEVTVLESNGCTERRSRKRCRDGSISSSISDVSPCSNEVFLSDPDLDSPTNRTEGERRRCSKRPRTAFTTTQLKGLEYYFRICPYPDSMGRDVISRVTGIDDTRIQVWFQNRRARYRKREQPLSKPKSVSPTTTYPTTPTPPHSHTDHTLKGLSSTSPRPAAFVPTTTPTLTPGMLGSYYAATMAYYMQAACSKPQAALPPLPMFPFPYLLPMAPAPPTSMQETTPTTADN